MAELKSLTLGGKTYDSFPARPYWVDVTITGSATDGTYSTAATAADVLAAIEAGLTPVVRATGTGDTEAYYVLALIIYEAPSTGKRIYQFTRSNLVMALKEQANGSFEVTNPYEATDEVTTLPNPYKLTFTGAVSAEYDGSAAVSVEIPDASDIELDTTLSVEGKAADAKAVGDRLFVLENNTPAEGGGGLTVAQVNALDGMFKIASYTEDPASAYAVFKAAFGIGDSGGGEEEPDEPVTPEVTLTSISATYSGGDVDAGTALTDLTGIVVTAHYSDGSTATVTDYTLSGEIVEGSNTITVSYGGMTTTFTVTGVAVVEPLYGVFFPPAPGYPWGSDTILEETGWTAAGNSGEYIDAGFPSAAPIKLGVKLQGTVYIRTLASNQYGTLEYAYRVYANADGEISTGGFTKVEATITRNLGTMVVGETTYHFVLFKFEIPAGQYGYMVSYYCKDYFVSADNLYIDDDYKQYYTLFTYDPSDRITEGAVEVS